MLKYFAHFTKMSFGFLTKLDYLILDNSLLAIEKLGIDTKPGEACTSLSSAQVFLLLTALAVLSEGELWPSSELQWLHGRNECLVFPSPGLAFASPGTFGKTFFWVNGYFANWKRDWFFFFPNWKCVWLWSVKALEDWGSDSPRVQDVLQPLVAVPWAHCIG